MFIKLTIYGKEQLINLSHIRYLQPEEDGIKVRIIYADGSVEPIDEPYSRIEFLLSQVNQVVI